MAVGQTRALKPVLDFQYQFTTATRATDGELVSLAAALVAAFPASRPSGEYSPDGSEWTDQQLADWAQRGGGEAWSSAGHVWVAEHGDNFLPRGGLVLQGPSAGGDAREVIGPTVDAARAFGCWYAVVDVLSPQDLARPMRWPLVRGGERIMEGAATIRNTLAELWWGTIYGPELSARFGRDRLAAAPAHRVEEVAPDTWWVQVTADPYDVLTDWEAFDERREAVKKALGRDRFWQAPAATRR